MVGQRGPEMAMVRRLRRDDKSQIANKRLLDGDRLLRSLVADVPQHLYSDRVCHLLFAICRFAAAGGAPSA